MACEAYCSVPPTPGTQTCAWTWTLLSLLHTHSLSAGLAQPSSENHDYEKKQPIVSH